MMAQKPPIRIIAPGRVYRIDSDATHTPMFHQIEGLVIDEATHLGHLKWCLEEFCKAFFEVDEVRMRFRASHFPFTEPSMEVDIDAAAIGKPGQWLEILGSGMVHPNVIRNCGLDPDKYQGFAFGMGLDRIAMLKYGIPDLRDMFAADLRWLQPLRLRRRSTCRRWPAGCRVEREPAPHEIHALLAQGSSRHHGVRSSELADKLSVASGSRSRASTIPARSSRAFTIARVLEAKQHPNADRLQVCKVDTGTRRGRGRVRRAQRQDRHDRRVRAHRQLHPRHQDHARGEARARRRLQRHAGVGARAGAVRRPRGHHRARRRRSASKLGQRYADVLGLGDPVIEVKLTPNRPDCTGVRGIARDLAAAGLGKLKPERKLAGVEGDYDCPVDIKLEFPKDARDACPCFAGRYIRGVKNGAAPAWMQQRLKAVGLRPINALVDVTNYISLDRGRPLHVYDADKLKGAIRARLGRKGEKFLGLDGKTHEVDETMCVIADDRAVLGFGGILGGEDTGCHAPTTKNMLIECAYFDPLRTAATGRKAGVQSDARYRFERGVDPAFILPGLDLATAMMLEVAGGKPSKAQDRRRAARDQDRHRLLASAWSRSSPASRCPEKQIRAHARGAGLRRRGQGRDASR